MMTDEDLKAAKALVEAATPGPWEAKGYGFGVGFCHGGHDDPSERFQLGIANAAFIAAARTLVPRLIAEVERLRAENEALKANAVLTSEYRFAMENIPTDGRGNPLCMRSCADSGSPCVRRYGHIGQHASTSSEGDE